MGPRPPVIAIIGAGPTGLIAAERLSAEGCRVTLYDAMPGPGRKLLMAGRGGLNLTHTEPLPGFLSRYGAAAALMATALGRFSPEDLRAWCHGLGIATFVGSSGRVFPEGMKASPLLRAWLRRLAGLGVTLAVRRRWQGFDTAGRPVFADAGPVDADATLLALGGASWPHLGADGGWVPILARTGIALTPLAPANCGFDSPWSAVFRERFAGTPLKNIALTAAGQTRRGELIVTRHGLEGGPLYAAGPDLRAELARGGSATVTLDLRPQLDITALRQRLSRPRGSASLSTFLRKAVALDPVGIALLRETGPLPDSAAALASRLKAVPVTLTGARPLARAISTAGGIRLDAVDAGLMLTALPGVFAAGEMLDWEAPTGGYLLQGCLATGVLAAEGILAYLSR